MEQTANNASAALGRIGNEESISRGAGPENRGAERFICVDLSNHATWQGKESDAPRTKRDDNTVIAPERLRAEELVMGVVSRADLRSEGREIGSAVGVSQSRREHNVGETYCKEKLEDISLREADGKVCETALKNEANRNRPRFARRKISTMLKSWNALREAIRAGDPEETEKALELCEPWIDFAFQHATEQGQ